MDEKKFSVGDVVILKSGGPDMTIIETEKISEQYVTCQWFDEHKVYEKNFVKAALCLAEEIDKNNIKLFTELNK